MIRRAVLAAILGTPFSAARAGERDLRDALRRHFPPGLDPIALGARLRAANPEQSVMEWRIHAPLGAIADLPARAAADFAAGRTLAVDGWLLSRTEARLCAALA